MNETQNTHTHKYIYIESRKYATHSMTKFVEQRWQL